VAEKVCAVHGVNSGELRSGSRRTAIVKARRVFSLLAVKELGYSGAAVARYLGVTNSCVTRAVLAEDAPEKENYRNRGRSSYLHILACKTYLTMLFVTYAKTIKNRCPGGLTSQEFALLLGCQRVGCDYGFYSQET